MRYCCQDRMSNRSLIPSQIKEDHTRLVCRARAWEETEIPQGTESRLELTWRRVRPGRGAVNWFLRGNNIYDSHKYFWTGIILNNIILTRITWNKQACSKPFSVYFILEKHRFHLQQQADRKSFAPWSVNISFLNYLEPFFQI